MKASVRREEELRDLLVSKGLRVTDPRLLLVREMAGVKAPISHPELTERLLGASLDRATVYRNLLTLADAGVLVRAQLGDQVLRYELPRTHSSGHTHHPHLVCSDCGNVRCLPAGTAKLYGEAAKNEVSQVQLRGRCASCLKSLNEDGIHRLTGETTAPIRERVASDPRSPSDTSPNPFTAPRGAR